MGFAILTGGVVLIALVWFFTRGLPRNSRYATRVCLIGVTLGVAGMVIRGESDSLFQAAGTILTNIGVAFIIIGLLVFVRAYMVGEFNPK